MIKRNLSEIILEAAQKLPVITLTGPRQSGKTTLVKAIFAEHTYTNLEYPDTREYATTDPRGFLRSAPYMIIDEVQHVPHLTSYMQGMVDEDQRPAQFVLTGSQNFSSSLPNYRSSSSTGDNDRRITSGGTIPVTK